MDFFNHTIIFFGVKTLNQKCLLVICFTHIIETKQPISFKNEHK
jgi:hypothetical protein